MIQPCNGTAFSKQKSASMDVYVCVCVGVGEGLVGSFKGMAFCR